MLKFDAFLSVEFFINGFTESSKTLLLVGNILELSSVLSLPYLKERSFFAC